jgi:hypothetical protein
MHSLKKTRRLVFADFDPMFETAVPFAAATRMPAAENSARVLPVSRAMPAMGELPALPLLPYHRATWQQSQGVPVNSPMQVTRRRFQRRMQLPPPALPLLPTTR